MWTKRCTVYKSLKPKQSFNNFRIKSRSWKKYQPQVFYLTRNWSTGNTICELNSDVYKHICVGAWLCTEG